MYLRDRSDKEHKCWPGINTIAAELNCSRSTIKRALHDLEKHGYIRRLPRYRESGSRSSNLYVLVNDWVQIYRQGVTAPIHCTQPQFTVDHLEGNTLSISTERKTVWVYYTFAHWTCLEVRKKNFSENVSKKVKIYPLTIWGSFLIAARKAPQGFSNAIFLWTTENSFVKLPISLA